MLNKIYDRRTIIRVATAALFTLSLFLCSQLAISITARGNDRLGSKTSLNSKQQGSLSALNDTTAATPHDITSPIPITDSQTSSNPGLHIVVAHYSEEPYYIRPWLEDVKTIPFVQEIGVKVTIYTKSENVDRVTLKQASGADEVIQLPNVGREGGTYLYHLLRIYDHPPAFVMFTQSYIKKAQQETGERVAALKPWLYERLMGTFTDDTGFMSLDRKHDICYCGHCTDMGRDDFYPLWPQIYAMLQNQVCQALEGHILSFNGHFIVSKKRILARPRSVYEYLKELVDAPEDHWVHTEPQPEWFEKEKGKSTPSDPKFGHTLERLWHTLFDCSDPADMTDCQLKGMKAEDRGGCTCKDHVSP